MSDRVHKFAAASSSRKDVVIQFDDGREFTFPGDVDADAFLNFVQEFGEQTAGEEMPAEILLPMLTMLLGADRLKKVRLECTLSEVILIGRTLWLEYMGLMGLLDAPEDGGGADAEGKQESDSETSSKGSTT